ncbi:unnamed protein product [Parajaminaea phylloscopi]
MTSDGTFERSQQGYRGNLTPWQQDALYELWTRFFRLCQTPAGAVSLPDGKEALNQPQSQHKNPAWSASIPETTASSLAPSTAPSRKPSREELSHTISTPNFATATASQASGSKLTQVSTSGSHIPKDDAIKAQVQELQESKEMRIFIARYGGERLRQVFWQMVKGEHPDAIMLRLLRARKWNVDRAIAVLGSTASWRVENNVEEIISGGELELTRTRGGMNILRNGISYIYGASATGEPVYVIEVGRHFSASQTQDELKRGVILLQEVLQSAMPPPTERKIVIFNMNEFGIRNMDWWCVFFMVKTMECFYVETLARVYVHGAPWIFKPIWSILKPLLDPVVRDKIRLTSDPAELAEYVPLDHLTKDSMRGSMDWVFSYPLPEQDENNLQHDTVTRERLQEAYFSVCLDLEQATRAVAKAQSRSPLNKRRGSYKSVPSDMDDSVSFVGGAEYDETPELASLKAKRDVLATKLRVAWLRLAPYQVGKTKLHRWNVLQPDGTIVWSYPKLDGSVEKQVLGEATSLPALESNLAAIEANGDLGPVLGIHSDVGLDGWASQERMGTARSRTGAQIPGQNGNKKTTDRSRKKTSPVPGADERFAEASPAVVPKSSTFDGEDGVHGSKDARQTLPETRPSTSESASASACSHPSGSSAFHSMSTIHPRNRLSNAVERSEGPDTPASSVHPLDDEAASAAGPSPLPAAAHKNSVEGDVPVHPLDKGRSG